MHLRPTQTGMWAVRHSLTSILARKAEYIYESPPTRATLCTRIQHTFPVSSRYNMLSRQSLHGVQYTLKVSPKQQSYTVHATYVSSLLQCRAGGAAVALGSGDGTRALEEACLCGGRGAGLGGRARPARPLADL